MAAGLIYAFNGLVFSKEVLELSVHLSSLPAAIVFASIVVVCIIGWLVHYTTGFMLTKRSRELGTYILIGLESRQVTRLFLMENLTIGGAALVLGTLLGNLLFQVLRAIVLALFGMPYHFGFSFSLRALGLTLLYFVLIYLFAQIKSRMRIRSMKIYDLIYYEKINEDEIIQRSGNRRKTFIVSIVFGVIGTSLIMIGHALPSFAGAACIIVFLYGFFISFSSGVPAYFENRPAKKYSRQTLLVFRTLSAKLATMGVVMATISLLFTAVLISQGMGLIFSSIFHNREAQSCSFDLYIASYDTNVNLSECLDFVHTNIPVTCEMQYPVYMTEDSPITDYLETSADYYRYYPKDTMMKYSDYAALRAMLGYPEATLEPGKYLIHCASYIKEYLEDYDTDVTSNEERLTQGNIYTENFNQRLYLGGNGFEFLLVLPDELLEECTVGSINYAAMTESPVSEAQYISLTDLLNRYTEPGAEDYIAAYTKAQAEADAAFGIVMFTLPLYYLALILTMTTVTILTVHQLSEMNRYRQQFTLLRKLGMGSREMVRTLRTQFAIYYAMPAIPPLFITIPFILHMGQEVDPGILVGTSHPIIILGITLGLFFLIYAIYILLAYTGLRRNVLPYA
ncbi:MAG: ABC transporter permease [Lachnospiraceae bacterium]|nr:ABC transporter permease [Lachnospiraceae bacterium]